MTAAEAAELAGVCPVTVRRNRSQLQTDGEYDRDKIVNWRNARSASKKARGKALKAQVTREIAPDERCTRHTSRSDVPAATCSQCLNVRVTRTPLRKGEPDDDAAPVRAAVYTEAGRVPVWGHS